MEGRDDFRQLYEGHHSAPVTPVEEEEADSFPRGRRQRAVETSDSSLSREESRGHRRSQHRERGLGGSMGSNVIGLPSVSQPTSEVVVIEPRSFDEMAQVVQHLRDRKTVIMNLTLMDPADAQRSVDFVAGGTYAIDGHQERIGENIFLFTPSTVTVSTPGSQMGQPLQRPLQSPAPLWSSSYDNLQAVGQH
ncbi:cell division protein SepF [Synechococcus sp. Nb3U1]|uniref:cell division protein SepF n=1 Tax=Synechococcus sp. Nb3U1 TaxID=1914529 RepID=UPI001F1F9F85|nr:cell division protein SepF [Synechococcus sp. Nb3U1]MCF2972022.1 cell division protein SepF [Synechococcus sp. Nb3U1]